MIGEVTDALLREIARIMVRLKKTRISPRASYFRARREARFNLFFRQNACPTPMFRVVAAQPSIVASIQTISARYLSFDDVDARGRPFCFRASNKETPNCNDDNGGDRKPVKGGSRPAGFFLIPMRLGRYFLIAAILIALAILIDPTYAKKIKWVGVLAPVALILFFSPIAYYFSKVFVTAVRPSKWRITGPATPIFGAAIFLVSLTLVGLGLFFLVFDVTPFYSVSDQLSKRPEYLSEAFDVFRLIFSAFFFITVVIPWAVFVALRIPVLPIIHGVPTRIELRYLRTAISYRFRPFHYPDPYHVMMVPILLSIFQVNPFRYEPAFWGGRQTLQRAAIQAATRSLLRRDQSPHYPGAKLTGPFYSYAKYFFYCWSPVWSSLLFVMFAMLLKAVSPFQAYSLTTAWVVFTLLFWACEWSHIKSDFDLTADDQARLPSATAPPIMFDGTFTEVKNLQSLEMTAALAGVGFSIATVLFSLSQSLAS